MTLKKFLDWLIEYSFYSLFFLVPLVMTPWNYELFEYNKMVLTYAFTVIITGAWIAKMVLQRKILLSRSPFDIPLLLFFASQLLSFLFSIDRHTSFWGYYSRFHGGLLSTISYLLLYFAFVANFDKQKVLNVLRVTISSALLVSVYGILEHFGIDAQYWVQDVKSRVFSTLGQPNWLAAYLAIILPLPIAFALRNFKNRPLLPRLARLACESRRVFYSSTLLLCILSLLFTKSRSGIPATAVSLLVLFFLLLLPKILSFKKQYLLTSLTAFVALLTIGLFLGFRTLFPNLGQDIAYIFGFTDQVKITMHTPFYGPTAYGSSSGDIRKIVWRGAVDVFKHYPLLGSGVETFAYSYYNFRPVQHNLLSEWDFLYNKAHNEYFNFLATTGAVGTGAYLLLIGWVLWWNIKRVIGNKKYVISGDGKDHASTYHLSLVTYHSLLIALFSGYSSILVTNFFGFSVVPVALYFFLIPAMAFILSKEELNQPKEIFDKKTNTRRNDQGEVNSIQYTTLAIIFLVAGYLLYMTGRYWWGDTKFAGGLRLDKQGYYDQAFNLLQEAVKLNPGEPVYKDELAWSTANLALWAAEQKQPETTSKLANLAISYSDQALATSPRNLNFLKTRAKILFQLSQVDGRFFSEATNVLSRVRELAPTDAKISYNLGLAYLTLGDKQKAVQSFEEAVKLKVNYLEARNVLATTYKELGKKQEAISILEEINKIYNEPKDKL